ncbi:S24/S26 family peptidase [Solirubrobacter taibaiensis]|nr:S24/S26 family peptidase [Solirubrobacter taibaiensis]
MPPTHLLVAAPGLRVSRPRAERAQARAGGTRWIFVATLLLAVAAALGYLNTWPPLATVMSASMAPTINTGDIVVLKRLDAPAAIGQVVMVRVPDDARARFGYPPVVIHRVVKIAADGTVTTKGDAKEEIDPFTVPRSAIDTHVLTHIPAAGQAFGFLSSTLGLLWLAGGAALFFGWPLLERYRETQRRVVSDREERELVLEALRSQVELLPSQIERAVATAVAAIEPAAPRATPRLVASSTVAAPAPVVTAPRPAAPAAPAPRPVAPAVPAVIAPTPVVPAVVAPAPVVPVFAMPAPGAHVLAAAIVVTPVVAAPARVVSASQFEALALARRTPPPAPTAPPAPPSRFPTAPARIAAPACAPPPAARVAPRPGALCAVGGP